ncbi:MAG: GNAT family N-acetyltransferase [Betaproteobacteria bacterium]
MALIPISARPEAAQVLYDLLAERPGYANISHKRMPTWEEHIRFMRSNPYRSWFLIEEDCGMVGAIYLSKQNEIGIGIFKKYQSKGYATKAVTDLRRRYPSERLLANVAPGNKVSQALWESLGGKLVQQTYELAL